MSDFFKGLNKYTVTLIEDSDITDDTIIFECWGEDKMHAEEQCYDAYPKAVIIFVE